MINVATVLEALQQQLIGHASMEGFTIERGVYVNRDPSVAPWCGIYKASLDYDPATIGEGSRAWKGTLNVTLVVQDNSLANGEEADVRLEEAIKNTLNAVYSNKKLSGNVDMLVSSSIDYSYVNIEEMSTLAFQEARITLTYNVRTNYNV